MPEAPSTSEVSLSLLPKHVKKELKTGKIKTKNKVKKEIKKEIKKNLLKLNKLALCLQKCQSQDALGIVLGTESKS